MSYLLYLEPIKNSKHIQYFSLVSSLNSKTSLSFKIIENEDTYKKYGCAIIFLVTFAIITKESKMSNLYFTNQIMENICSNYT